MKKTKHYQVPQMPWGVHSGMVGATLRAWVPDLVSVQELSFNFPRGIYRWMSKILKGLPVFKRHLPTLTRVRFADRSSAGAFSRTSEGDQ